MADEASGDERISLVTEPGKILVRGDLVRAQIERLVSFELPPLEGQVPDSRLEIALGQVGAIDTAGMAFLLTWQSQAAARSITVRYTHPPKAMRPMLLVYGLNELMTVEGV